MVHMTASGAANAAVVFNVSDWAQQIGTKSFKVRKIRIRDNGTGGTVVHFGTGTGGSFADAMPAFKTLSGLDAAYPETELPEAEFFADMTAYPEAVNGSSVDIQVEAEEIG